MDKEELMKFLEKVNIVEVNSLVIRYYDKNNYGMYDERKEHEITFTK